MPGDPREARAVQALEAAKFALDEYAAVVQGARKTADWAELTQRANDIYPRIWESLHAARNLVAEFGHVAAFDGLAAEVGDTLSGGVLDASEVRERFVGVGVVREQDVSVSFNVRGLELGRAAWESLTRQIPGVDFTFANEAEDVARAVASLQRGSWKGRLPLIVVICVLASPFLYLAARYVAAGVWWPLIVAIPIFGVAFLWALGVGRRFG